MNRPALSGRHFAACLVGLVAASAAPSAGAFVLADTCGHSEPDCPVLHWETDGDPIPFRLHHDGSDEHSMWSIETRVRSAFGTWAAVEGADIDFLEGGIFMGAADYQETDAIDRQSVLFFMEEGWAPRSPEVIALTSISFGEGGVIIEADIGFNADDWTFTVGDSGVRVDFLSIAVHEIGHFLGLDHSEEDGATMNARYTEGDTSLRDLTDDDRAGISAMYPCEDVPCVGDVGPGCSMGAVSPRQALAVLLLVLLGASARDRRRRARLSGAAVLGLMLLVPNPSTGSVVESLDVDALAARADLVVRARVADVEPYLAGKVRSRISLDVLEALRGLAPETIVIDQPGGRLPTLGTYVFGMPRFEVDREVVVFLSWPEGGAPRVLGLAQGKMTVEADGSLTRDLSGLALASMGRTRPATSASLPGGVEGLRLRLAR